MAGTSPDWAVGVDAHAPSAARVWDYFLGGSHNFASDRAVGDAAIAMKPDMPELARQVRMFLYRAVRTMVNAGIDQFLDIGAGIPTVGNVHEIARALNPRVRVAYVDHDPVAVIHASNILAGDPNVLALEGDLRGTAEILTNARVRRLLDFDQPVGVLLVGVLHFIADTDDPARILATLRDGLAPGSMVAIQHASHDQQPADTIAMLQMWNERSPEPMTWRTREQITDLVAGFTVLEPGVVYPPVWRPDPDDPPVADPQRFASYALLARKDG